MVNEPDFLINGAGLAACFLAADLAQERGRSVCLAAGHHQPAHDYMLAIDRSDLLQIARRLKIAEGDLVHNARKLSGTISAWRTAEYGVADSISGLGGEKFAMLKSTLEILAQSAVENLGVRLVRSAEDASAMRRQSRQGINALGRSACRRSAARSSPRVFIGNYRRFVIEAPTVGVDIARDAHVIEALPQGWVSVLPVGPGGLEIVYYSDAQLREQRHRSPWLALQKIADECRILRQTISGNNVHLRTHSLGYIVSTDVPARAYPGSVSVGDALFPHEPLSGQGVKFAIWSARRVCRLLTGDPGYSDFNHDLLGVSKTYHTARHRMYDTVRWRGQGYWRSQAAFSEALATHGHHIRNPNRSVPESVAAPAWS